jgi:hypothetical protein
MKCGYLHVHTVKVFTVTSETFEELLDQVEYFLEECEGDVGAHAGRQYL